MEWAVGLAFWCLIWGGIAALIGQRKNLGVGGSFALGGLLGIIGVIIVICQKSGLPPAPAGTRAVKCPRCNVVQNIALAAPSYDCWQCHQAVPVQYRPGWRRPTRLLPQRINQLPNNRDAASSAHCAMRSCQSRRQLSGLNAQNAKRLVPHRTGHKFGPPPKEWVAGRVVGQTRVSADRYRAIPSAIAIQQDSPRFDANQASLGESLNMW